MAKFKPILLTGDIHLTDNEADEYRWDVFPWLLKRCDKYGVESVIIMGDLTHFKDKHSSRLVNRLVENLQRLRDAVEVYVLMGNHDYKDAKEPFFEFLTSVNIPFITKPRSIRIAEREVLLLPHTHNPNRDWKEIEFTGRDLILLHQTLNGACGAQGQTLDSSVAPRVFGTDRVGKALVFSGDVHVPQTVGNVTYVGAPHPVHVGDMWEPRVVLVDDKQHWRCLWRKTIQKPHLHVKDADELKAVAKELDLREGDVARVTIRLSREEYGSWSQHREACRKILEDRGVNVAGIQVEEQKRKQLEPDDESSRPMSNPSEALEEFIQAKGVPDSIAKAGREILNNVLKGAR